MTVVRGWFRTAAISAEVTQVFGKNSQKSARKENKVRLKADTAKSSFAHDLIRCRLPDNRICVMSKSTTHHNEQRYRTDCILTVISKKTERIR
jgi:hypothetical protein